jgi:hypothetical protein
LFCLGTGIATVFRGSRWFDPESLGSWRRDTIASVDAVTGCFLLIRRPVWESLEGFDESFFMYGEDTDLCLRAWNADSACIICPDARIIHHGGRSEKVRSEKMLRLFEAKARLIEKHWKRGHVWFGVRMLDLWCMTRMMLFGLAARFNTKYAVPYQEWAGIWHARARFHVTRVCSRISASKEMAGAIGPS